MYKYNVRCLINNIETITTVEIIPTLPSLQDDLIDVLSKKYKTNNVIILGAKFIL